MKLITAAKFNIWDTRKDIAIFYGIIYLILSAFAISRITGSDSVTISGMELATIIFLFITGLNYFSETFGMFLQNGLSRLSIFKSYLLSFLPIVIFMAIIDSINGSVIDNFFGYESMYAQLYGMRYLDLPNWLSFFEGMLWYIFVYTAFITIGLFITTLYYRMNKTQKVAVSVGVPVFLVIIFPIINRVYFDGAIARWLFETLVKVMGLDGGFNPYYGMASFLVVFALFAGLSYTLIHRAVIRD